MTTPPPPEEASLPETVAKAAVKFPGYLLENFGTFLLAVLTDWNTTLFVIATGVLAYVTDPLPVIAVATILYIVLRIAGECAATVAQQINFHARVNRDKVDTVNITQLPEVLVRQAQQLDALAGEPREYVCPNCGTPQDVNNENCSACGH